MRTRLMAVVLWCTATGLAVALVSGGVRTIRSAARPDSAVDVHAVAVSDRSSGAGATREPPAAPVTTAAGPVSAAAPTTTAPPAAAPSTTVPSSAAPTTTVLQAGDPPTDAGPPSTTSPPAAPPTTLAPAAGSPATRTIVARGGSVTVRADATSVVVVAATPNPGFTTKVDQRGPTEIRVEFESSGHRSRIEAWWAGGLQSDVREG